MSRLSISEIFHSIQGEGVRAGKPCTFIRLHGCGLRCTWCDTPYALDHSIGGAMMAIQEIEDKIAAFGCNFVEFTGGEPLEQEAVFPFIASLCDKGYEVAIETGGHVNISAVDNRAIIIMDVKCPGSGMMKRNRLENLQHLKPSDEVKFVIADRTDYEWLRDFVREHHSALEGKELLFSPVFGSLENIQLAEWILADKLNVRMQLQMHKYIWHPDARGV